MAEVDVSSYRQPEQPSIIARFGETAGVANALAQNRLLGIETGALTGMASAFKQSTNPDGSVDFNKLIGLAPLAGPKAGEIVQSAQEALRRQNEINTAGMQAVQARWGNRLNSGGSISHADLAKDVTDLAATGQIPASVTAAALRMIPPDSSPDALKAFASQQSLGAVSPESQNQTVTNYDPATGKPIVRTAGQAATMARNTGGFVGGPPAGFAEAASTTAQGAAQMGVELVSTADASGTRLAALNNMAQDIGEFTSGPLSGKVKELTAAANQAFGTSFDATGVAAQERFSKLAKQIALAQSGALHGTDLTTETSLGASPNVDLSKLGNTQIISMLQGNEDTIRAKADGWQKWLAAGNSPASYGLYSIKFNKEVDPRFFQALRMSPEDRAKMLEALPNDKARNEFRQRFNAAVNAGWIPDPRGSANAQ